MPKLIVKDVPGLDGEYDCDLTRFKAKEGRLIKRLSGVRMGEILEGLKAVDSDLLTALGVVMLWRDGKDPDMVEELLWEADFGSVMLDLSTPEDVAAEKQAEADARPPESPIVSGDESGPASSVSASEPTGSSGDSSTNGSGLELVTESLSGSLPSGTGAISGPEILAS